MAEIGYARAILGGGRRAWGTALLEIVVVGGLSLVPLLAGAVREILVPPVGVVGEPFQRAFLSGQLIFYAVGLVATVIWQSNKDRVSFSGWRHAINGVCVIVVGLCCIAVGADPTLETLNREALAAWSVGLFAVSVIVYVLMALIGEVQVNVGGALAKSDEDLSSAVRKSRGIE